MTNADAVRLARVNRIVDAALERKAQRVVALDVRALVSYAETFVIATGTSDRHAQSIADSVSEIARADGSAPIGIEGYDEGRWVLIDLGDAIVHVFQPGIREEYDLERLWSDAPPIAHGSVDAVVLHS